MLNHVVDYALKHVPGSEPGFTMRPIHWLLHISPNGGYINVEPYGERKKGKQREMRCPDMPNMRAGGDAKRAHFLVENTLTAALYVKDKGDGFKSHGDDKAVRRNAYFLKLLLESACVVPPLKPAAEFFASVSETAKLRQALGTSGAVATDWLMFRIGEFNPIQDDVVLTWWRSWLAKDIPAKVARIKTHVKAGQAIDLVSGDMVDPKVRHPPLKGLEDVGGNPSGTPLICFDKHAFSSYGLKEGGNAAMSATNAQLYIDGLTYLLKSSHRIAGARMVYWYRKDVPRTQDPLAFFTGFYTEDQIEAGAVASAKDLLRASEDGRKPVVVDNQFFAMTLSGASGRAMVRDWMEGDFGVLAANVKHWFDDLEVVGITGRKTAPEQKFETVVTSMLPEKRRNQKYNDWVKPIGPGRRQLLHSAIERQHIPSLVIERIAALLPAFLIRDDVNKALSPNRDRSEGDSIGLIVSSLYARLGLIKAYFIRLKPGGDPTMTAYLNPQHPEAAYQCGRLLSILSNLQREALDDVGANVVQQFYMGFSRTPGLLMGRLIANAQNHLTGVRKKNPDLAWWYEDLIAEVKGRLGDRAPRILNPEGQGLFALGYYQQLARLRAGSKSTTEVINQQGVLP